jgi:hypothetical protein
MQTLQAAMTRRWCLAVAAAAAMVRPGSGKAQDGIGSKFLNDSVRRQLADLGDDGSTPREVTQFVYPLAIQSRQPAEVVRRHLERLGMVVTNTQSGGGLIGTQTREVASADFDALTASLVTEMAELGWQYDGWETAVVHPET